MTNWKNKIDISKEFELYNDEKCTVKVVAQALATALHKSPFGSVSLVQDYIAELEMLDEDDAEQFDDILGNLYEFGDTKKRLFIKTF